MGGMTTNTATGMSIRRMNTAEPNSTVWSNGLFECFGDCGAMAKTFNGACGTCCYAWFCPCCAAGEIYEAAEMGECMVGCLLFCLLEPCHPCIVTGPLRMKLGIEGDCMQDTCAYCCCVPCQLTRELREVRGI